MTALNFAKFILVLCLICKATATPCEQSVNIFANGRRILVHNLSACSTSVVMINGEKITVPPLSRTLRFLHSVAKRSTMAADEDVQGRSASMEALKETAKLLQMTAMLPAETLRVLRMVSVPLLNTTLGVPANLLEGIATMSLGKEVDGAKTQARTSANGLWEYLAHLKLKPHHHLLLHKNITLGPLSLKKVLEIGTPKIEATTPPPAIVPETPPAPAVIPATTPAPVVIPETTPAPAVIPETTPPPVVVVPVTEPPQELVLPSTTPPPAAVVPETPPPAVVVPSAALPVVAPPPPKCTNQIAIVQNSPSETNISENPH